MQSGNETRLQTLDDRLWTLRDDSFIPHGIAGQGDDKRQPILLSTGADIANNANVLMLIDGAKVNPDAMAEFDLVAIFLMETTKQLSNKRA